MQTKPQDEAGQGDVPALVAGAYQAARRGDLEGLESALARLKLTTGVDATELAAELVAIANCVRAHPSWRPVSEGREAS